MRSLHKGPGVSEELVHQIDEALVKVDTAKAELARVIAQEAPLLERRAAHTEVRRAFDAADAPLRQATRLAKEASYRDWALWRHRLSALDTDRQIHLFAEQDQVALRPIGAIRAIDTGMSGPDIGELQHGEASDPGSPARYGLDIEAVLKAGNGRSALPAPQ